MLIHVIFKKQILKGKRISVEKRSALTFSL